MKTILCCCVISVFLFGAVSVFANDTTIINAKASNEITKLQECKLPEEMFHRIKKMKPAEMAVLREELQQPTREEGEEKLLTIKLRYYADFIIGIIKEAPFNQSNKELIVDKRINIPVKWTCKSDSMGHEPHTVLMSEMKSYEQLYKCKNWSQEDELSEEAQFGKPDEAVPAKKKKKKLFGF